MRKGFFKITSRPGNTTDKNVEKFDHIRYKIVFGEHEKPAFYRRGKIAMNSEFLPLKTASSASLEHTQRRSLK